MLITLYLILINSYNSIDAPPDRGFSSIEVWFYGMQTLILLAVLEYGIVLAMKKVSNGNKLNAISLFSFHIGFDLFYFFFGN